MGLQDLFLASQAAAPKKRNPGEKKKYLHIMNMSKKPWTPEGGEVVPGCMGNVKFLPIRSITGEDARYLNNVLDYKYEYDVELEDENGNAYTDTRTSICHYADVKDYQHELSDDEKASIIKVRSLINHYIDLDISYDARVKNYALIFGYVLEHHDIENNFTAGKNEDGTVTRYPALIVVPSKSFSAAMAKMTKRIMDLNELANETYEDLFGRKTKRIMYVSFDFTKSANSFGYDSDLEFKYFDRLSRSFLTDEELRNNEVTIPQEDLDFCTSLNAVFLANNRNGAELYDPEHPELPVIPKDFDPEFTDGVIAQLENIFKEIDKANADADNLPVPPSKNGRTKSDLDE